MHHWLSMEFSAELPDFGRLTKTSKAGIPLTAFNCPLPRAPMQLPAAPGRQTVVTRFAHHLDVPRRDVSGYRKGLPS